MSPIQIGKGHVYHSRKEGAANSFRYPTFYIYFCCDQENELQNLLRTKFRYLLSFKGYDYLQGQMGPVDSSVKKFIRDYCNYEAEEVWLHTLPRMFGYVFNPVTFWICRRDQKVEAVLVEVNNTFGERHFYWIHPQEQITNQKWYRAEKVFHVSPFFPVDGFYQFRFQLDEDSARIDINYHNPSGPLRLATWVTGRAEALADQSALALFSTYGWMTQLVVLRIHYQAFKLWIKKTRFHRKPALPQEKVSL